jgi:hypothetical protein
MIFIRSERNYSIDSGMIKGLMSNKQKADELEEEILLLFEEIKNFQPESKLLWKLRIFCIIFLLSPIAK